MFKSLYKTSKLGKDPDVIIIFLGSSCSIISKACLALQEII